MDARERLRSGDVQGALSALKEEVRKAQREPRLRTFLFQMFCLTGEWERALNQLAVVAEMDPKALPMVQTYRVAIRCEVLRERVFRGESTPLVMGEPGAWLPLLIEANRLLAQGNPEQAARLRDAAFDQADPVPGAADGAPFEWLADADPRLGPVLEAIVDGKYYWVPYANISRIALDPPEDLRDKVWLPAQIRWITAGETVALIPTRYPGSAQSPDPLIQLAQKTEWGDDPAELGWALPAGQRMVATDVGEHALMDLREITFGAPPEADPAPAA